MHGSHGLGLAPPGEEVFRRLVEVEEEETTHEHEEGKRAERDGEVPPASVVGTVAACNTWGSDGAGFERCVAAMAWDQTPCD